VVLLAISRMSRGNAAYKRQASAASPVPGLESFPLWLIALQAPAQKLQPVEGFVALAGLALSVRDRHVHAELFHQFLFDRPRIGVFFINAALAWPLPAGHSPCAICQNAKTSASASASFGNRPTIASLSLRGERRFQFRHRETKQTITLGLRMGHWLIMAGETQRIWVHQVPKTAAPVAPRVNLSFRHMILSRLS
jgi:2OG-Fe(II) oxygenase superfamily